MHVLFGRFSALGRALDSSGGGGPDNLLRRFIIHQTMIYENALNLKLQNTEHETLNIQY